MGIANAEIMKNPIMRWVNSVYWFVRKNIIVMIMKNWYEPSGDICLNESSKKCL